MVRLWKSGVPIVHAGKLHKCLERGGIPPPLDYAQLDFPVHSIPLDRSRHDGLKVRRVFRPDRHAKPCGHHMLKMSEMAAAMDDVWLQSFGEQSSPESRRTLAAGRLKPIRAEKHGQRHNGFFGDA